MQRSWSSAAAAALLIGAAALAQDAGAQTTSPELDVARLPFTPDSIKMVMQNAHPRIEDCYEQMLAGMDKPVSGKLMTSFVITPAGNVTSARVLRRGTTLSNRELHACVTRVLSVLSFPRPPDGKQYPIEFPFNLKAIK